MALARRRKYTRIPRISHGIRALRTAALGFVSLHHVLDATQQAETLPRIPLAQDYFRITELPDGGEAAIAWHGGVLISRPPQSNVFGR